MISSQTRRTQVTLSGPGQTISIPWYFLDEGDLVVVSTDPDSYEDTTLVLNTDYTTTGEGEEAGGSVILAAGAQYDIVTVYGGAGLTQTYDLQNYSQLSYSALERAYDRLTMLVQQLQTKIANCLRVPVSNTPIAEITRADRLNTVVGFDEDGDFRLVDIDDLGGDGEAAVPYVDAPASPTSAGSLGDRAYSDGYIYECVVEGAEGAALWVQYPVATDWSL